MKGSIRERGNSYQIRVCLGKDPQTGKYSYYAESVTGNKKDAEKRLHELLSELDKGTFIKPGKSTLAEYLRVWLNDYVKPNLAGNTMALYTIMCEKHIIPAIGQCPVVDLKPQHVQHLYAEKQKSGLSNRTVQIIHVTLHKALANAVKIGLIPRNVTDIVDKPKVKRHEARVMNEYDCHIFPEMVRDTEYYALFYTYLHTGMRRGEALALRWLDVDLLLCQVSINRSLEHLRNSKHLNFKETKTPNSRRMIDLTPSNVAVLQEHREVQYKQREALGLPPATDNDLVFCHWDGSPLLPNSVTNAWRKLAKRCGLEGTHPHTARHSMASLMMKQGVPVKVISERLGHSGINITMDLYAHVLPGMQREAANKFDEMVIKQNST
jgi:integrase